MDLLTYEERCLETYGLTPAEFEAHKADMAEIAREEREERYHEMMAEMRRESDWWQNDPLAKVKGFFIKIQGREDFLIKKELHQMLFWGIFVRAGKPFTHHCTRKIPSRITSLHPRS